MWGQAEKYLLPRLKILDLILEVMGGTLEHLQESVYYKDKGVGND